VDDLRAFFERLAEEWDAQQPPDREEWLRRLLEPFGDLLQQAQAVLEVGTGTGALIPLLRESAPTARVVSIDLAYAMLRRARRRCLDALLVQADVHHLPFPPAAFDRVVCHNTFPHFHDKPAALVELARVLRSGGYLLILHDLGREQVNAIHRSVGGAIGNDLLPSGDELARLLQAGDFSPVEVEDSPQRYRAIGQRLPGPP